MIRFKSLFSRFALLVLLAILTLPCIAQPLTGTKTIGGTTPDFATIHAAIDTLNSVGVGTGGVTFLIRGGTYNESPDSITAGANSGPNARVVFRPADTLGVTINVTSTASATFAYKFFNVDYVTFDGGHSALPGRRLITVNATGTNGYYGFWIANGSDFCTVKNCVITVGNNTSSSYMPIRAYINTAQTPATTCLSDSLINNRIIGGYYGMYLYGQSAPTLSNWYIAKNQVVDFYYYAVYIYYVSNSIFKNNEVFRTTAAVGYNYMFYSTASQNVSNVYDGNWIHDIIPSTASSLYALYITGGANQLIINNMVDLYGGCYVLGMDLGSNQCNIINNSVHIWGAAMGSGNSMGIYIGSSTSQDTIANNIIINERTGNAGSYYNAALWLSGAYTTGSFAYSDYNILTTVDEATTDNIVAARFSSNNYNTLADLRLLAGYNWDTHSLGIAPQFVGLHDLHINTTAPTPVESAGFPFAAVTRDIDGDLRNTLHPDIGCDEGNFITAGDLSRPTIRFTPLTTWDTTLSRTFTAYITDNVGVALGANMPRVYYKRSTDATWLFRTADSTRDSTFFFTIPGFPMGATVNYYLAAQDTTRNNITFPIGGSGSNPPGTTPPANPLSYYVMTTVNGTKTIGGTNPDFATIHEAIDALNAAGTSRGVTFLIRGGTYNETPDSITASAQSGANSPVVFKPADTLGITINVTGTTAFTYGYKFFNADYVTFDGGLPAYPGRRFITVNATGTYGYYAFWIANGSDFCSVKNCVMTVSNNTSSTYRTVYVYTNTAQTPATNCNSDSLINNRVVGGYYGMYLYGSSTTAWSNWYIADNQVVDFYYYGIYIYYMANSKFHGNELFRTTQASTTNYFIYSGNTLNANNVFDGNWIHDIRPATTSTVYAMYMYYGPGKLISNNMIDLTANTGGSIYGIYLYTDQTNVINNTIHLGGTSGGSYNSIGLYMGSSTTQDTIANNIIINERTGGTVGSYYNTCIYNSNVYSTNLFAFSDYNILTTVDESTTDNCYVARYSSNNYNLLGDLRLLAGYNWDTHSLPIAPAFVGAPNLHIDPTAPTPVEGAGVPIASVPRDFDGDLRNTVHPDIGCDEGNFVTAGDLYRPVIRFTPLTTWDTTLARPITAYITDNVSVATGVNRPRVYYKRSTDTTWQFHLADSTRDSTYFFTIGGFPMGSLVNYYLAAQDTSQNNLTYPFGGSGSNPPGTRPPANPLSYFVLTTLNGTKTIGGTNPDFVSIHDAIDALNAAGTSRGVTFLIRGGTYNESPDSITAAAQSGPNTQVIFKPADTLGITINVASTSAFTYAYKFFNADYVTFDGGLPGYPGRRFMTIRPVGTYGYYAFWFANGSDFCCVKNCVIIDSVVSSSNYRAIYAYTNTAQAPTTNCNSDSLINNRIVGGYYGMYMYGNSAGAWSNWYVANNQVVDFYYYGIYIYYIANSMYQRNELFRTTTALTSNYFIYSGNTLNANNVFDGNWIHDIMPTTTGTVYGMYMYYGPGKLISNNMIDMTANAGGTLYGIYLYSDRTNVINNTIHLGGASGGTTYNSVGIYMGSSTTQDTLANNVIINERTGGTAGSYFNTCIYNSSAYTTNAFAYSDYNILSTIDETTTDNRYAARYGTNNYNVLDDLRQLTGYNWDIHSLGIPPPFINPPNLHINPNVAASVEGNATPFGSVLRDIDGDLRNTTRPDIGCDEGNFRRLSYGTILGTVRDSSALRTPIQGVVVSVGRYRDTTDVNGYYFMDVLSGVYDVTASTPCFANNTVNVQIDSAGVDTVNFFMLHPELATDVTSIELVAHPGQTRSTTLVLRNPGNAPLHWRATAVGNPHGLDFQRGGGERPPIHFEVMSQPTNPKDKIIELPLVDGATNKPIPISLPGGGYAIDELDTTGGPDSFGYRFIDSRETTGPTFGWVAITGTTPTLSSGSTDDGYYGPLNIGFNFSFYGTTYTQFYLGTNGYVNFGSGTTTIPSAGTWPVSVPAGVIFWARDASTTYATSVRYQTITGPNRLVVEIDGFAPVYSSNAQLLDVQVILYESGQILIQYRNYTGAVTANWGNIGIQTTNGNPYNLCYCRAANQAPPANTAIIFQTAPLTPPWLSADPTSGTTLPRQPSELFVQAVIDTGVTTPAVWTGSVQLVSDACPNSLTIPVSITITPPDEVKEATGIPLQYKLYQNYPNPFNPTTTLRFDLKQAGMTRLTIFNSLGQEVAEVVNQHLPAGYHSVKFDGSRIATGVYFYRIQSGNFQDLKKMVLVK